MRKQQPSAEALAEYHAIRKKEEDLAAHGSTGLKKWVKRLGKSAFPPSTVQENSPISGLSIVDSSATTSQAKLQSNPSWENNVVGPFKEIPKRQDDNERGTLLEERGSPEAKEIDLERDFAYPLPVPPLTQQQIQLHKKIDILEHTASAALATVNVGTMAGTHALNLVGKAFSYVVPQAIQDAPVQILPMLQNAAQNAAQTVGLDFTGSFDLSHLDVAVLKDFSVVAQNLALGGILSSMKLLIGVLKKFALNRAAACVHLRLLYSILAALARPHTGVVATVVYDGSVGQRSLSDPSFKPFIARIEEVLHSAVRVFRKFAGLNHDIDGGLVRGTLKVQNAVEDSFILFSPIAMLASSGSTLEQQFRSFHEQLVVSMDAFLAEVGISSALFDITSVRPDYIIFDNLQSALQEWSESEIRASVSRTGSLEYFEQCGGSEGLRSKIAAAVEYAQDKLIIRPQDLIGSATAKKWWMRWFGTAQRVSPDAFIKNVFHDSGGKSNLTFERMQDLALALESSLGRMTVERDGLIGITEFAIFFNAAPCNESNMFKILEIATYNCTAQKIKLIPPALIASIDGASKIIGEDHQEAELGRFSVSKIIWEDHQEAELGRAMHDSLGWTLVTGARGAGKTARVLSTLEWMPLDRDVMYVDLCTCRSSKDILFAIASQLLFRDCSTITDIQTKFRRFFKNNVRAHGILVFDNLEIDLLSPAEQQSFISTFDETVISLCAPFTKKCNFMLVSTSFPKKLATAFAEFVIPSLTETQANVLAKQLLPIDPGSLMIAGRRQAGCMAKLAATSSLATIRKIAAIYTVEATAVDAGTKCLIDGIEANLNDDQLLCAACMLTELAHFSEGHAWALCQTSFLNDIIRWRIAWQGLLDVAWVRFSPQLGYWVTPESMISRTVKCPGALTLALQTNAYTRYWARELARLNGYCYDSSSVMLIFDKYRQHYSTPLRLFMSDGAVKGTPLNEDSRDEKAHIATILVGQLDRVLNARYLPEEGETITKTVRACFPDETSLTHIHALRDHCLQMLRIPSLIPIAEKTIIRRAMQLYVESTDGLTLWDHALYDIAMGHVKLAVNKIVDAVAAFKLAETHLQKLIENKSELAQPEFVQGILCYVMRVLSKLEDRQKAQRMPAAPVKKGSCYMV